MFGLVVSAVGAMVAFSPYNKVTHCDTIGMMMMFAGLITLLSGGMAMFSACYEQIWAAKTVRIIMSSRIDDL